VLDSVKKQGNPAELEPKYNAGNLSTPSGNNAGLRLLERLAAQLEMQLLGNFIHVR
jgi:hypothetical protein